MNDLIFELWTSLGKKVHWGTLGNLQPLTEKGQLDRVARELEIFFCNGGQVIMISKPLVVWRTITVSPKSAAEYIAELEQAGIQISSYARNIMGKPGFRNLQRPRTIKLAKASIRSLGFTKRPTTDQLWMRIVQLGGEILPPEASPEIRKDHKGQEKETAFWVISLRDLPDIFLINCNVDGKLQLNATCIIPDGRWDLDDEVVFGLSE